MPLPGGPADKLGNRYELWWTISQLQRMLHGELTSIRIEDPGLQKCEFMTFRDSDREFHQAKRSHPSGRWTIADLAGSSHRLIQSIGAQLNGNEYRFVFVSSSDARELAELTERARDSANEKEFEGLFVAAKEQSQKLTRLRGYWDTCNIATAYDRLCRIEIRTIDERGIREQARLGAQALFLANPDDVCAELQTIALNSVHQRWKREALVEHLQKKGLTLRRLATVGHAAPIVNEITRRYLDGAKRKLILGSLVPRRATEDLLAKLGREAGDSVLTGRAGAGKTACVAEFVTQLLERDIPVLAFRLDRMEPVSTTAELGQRLGLEESPALVLASAAAGKEAVLVIDQLDAVSTTSGRAAGFLETIEALLVEARGIRDRLSLHVVVVCRDFDWRNDHSLRRLLPKEHTQVAVPDFTPDEVRAVLAQSGFDNALFEPRQITLLQLPQNLSLFLEGGFVASERPSFATAVDLFDRYWDQKRGAVAARVAPTPDHWADVIRILVEAMTTSQQLFVTKEQLDPIPGDYVSQMASEGVLTFDGRRYGFGHESFFDYCFARQFAGQNLSITAFLTTTEQHLFRRAQVRQVLVYLREADRTRYCRELSSLLQDARIRMHLKDLAVAVAANVWDPSDEEWHVWEPLIRPALDAIRSGSRNTDTLSKLAWQRFCSSLSWFRFMHARGLIAEWLASEEDRVVDCAILLLRAHQAHSAGIIVSLLEPYIGAGEKWTARLRYIMEWADLSSDRRFFELFLRLLDDGTLDEARGPIAVNSTFWNLLYGFGKEKPEWIPEVLAHWLRRRLRVAQTEDERSHRRSFFGSDAFGDDPIRSAASAAPEKFVSLVLPAILEISDWATITSYEPPRKDRVWPLFIGSERPEGAGNASLSGLREALAVVAQNPLVDLTDVRTELRRRDTYVANLLLLILYRSGGARFADEAAATLANEPWRFRCGWGDSEYWVARQTVTSIVQFCSIESRQKLEAAILQFSSEYEKTHHGFRAAGYARFNMLSAIPAELRSSTAQGVFRELERKFKEPNGPPQAITGGVVRSPIDLEAAAKMTDAQCLRAIARYQSEHDFASAKDFLKGGASELARTIGSLTAKEPERFGRLSLQFPAGTNPVYIQEILRNLGSSPADDQIKLAVCRKAYIENRDEAGSEICDVLSSIEEGLPDDAVEMLSWLATEHFDPSHERWREAADSSGTHFYGGDLYTNGINTTRGRAALAIGTLIFRDSEYIGRFHPILARMMSDPSASIQSCIAYTLVAIGYHDWALAMSLFLTMNLAEERLLATRHVYGFMLRGVPASFAQLRPFIERALRSQDPETQRAGAQLASISAMQCPEGQDLLAEALHGTIPQRVGVANVAASNVASADCREWCELHLCRFFLDDDSGVRKAAARCFHTLAPESLESYADLISKFCDSPAYQEDSLSILHTLESSLHRLPGMVCTVCEKFLLRFGDEARDIRTGRAGDAYLVSKLIFRAYHQHQNDAWAGKALDGIDLLCREGIGDIGTELEQFDR
jgi:hypothetical protein